MLAALSSVCARWGIGMGVASDGDCGIGESADESRIPVLIGMSGVSRGVRGAAEMAGDIAGTMFGEETMLVPRGLCIVGCEWRDVSDIERRRCSGGPPLMSMCSGAAPRCMRLEASASRLRRGYVRCSSRMKPAKRLRSTHLPMFTVPPHTSVSSSTRKRKRSTHVVARPHTACLSHTLLRRHIPPPRSTDRSDVQ